MSRNAGSTSATSTVTGIQRTTSIVISSLDEGISWKRSRQRLSLQRKSCRRFQSSSTLTTCTTRTLSVLFSKLSLYKITTLFEISQRISYEWSSFSGILLAATSTIPTCIAWVHNVVTSCTTIPITTSFSASITRNQTSSLSRKIFIRNAPSSKGGTQQLQVKWTAKLLSEMRTIRPS